MANDVSARGLGDAGLEVVFGRVKALECVALVRVGTRHRVEQRLSIFVASACWRPRRGGLARRDLALVANTLLLPLLADRLQPATTASADRWNSWRTARRTRPELEHFQAHATESAQWAALLA